MSKIKTQLGRWISIKGTRAVSQQMGVNIQTVRYWKNGHSLPKTSQMLKIRKLSGITADVMIKEFHSNI